jgi:hypothetical protein
MNGRNSRCQWLCLLFVASLVLIGLHTVAAPGATILFHGANTDASFGDDGLVLAHLQSLYGAGNVTYMQGEQAAADGSAANGFDAVIISSSLASGTVRNKYEDTTAGVLNWESALMRQAAGEFNMTVTGGTRDGQSQITIVDPSHPLAAGLSGTVTVFTSPQTASFGQGALGTGVHLVADGLTAGDHAIAVADVGDALLGDGSPESPAVAPGRRVLFFLQDANFGDLTPEGLQLFDTAVAWVVPEPATFVLCAMGLLGLLNMVGRRRVRS